jgi:GGDEF domain-containing protein
VGGAEGFVGHVGGDDFLMIVQPGLAEQLADKLCKRFDQQVPDLYDGIDLDRGGIEIKDRQGNVRTFPLLTLSIGIATTAQRRFTHFGEAVAVATEMKQFAKRTEGSSYEVDRRSA